MAAQGRLTDSHAGARLLLRAWGMPGPGRFVRPGPGTVRSCPRPAASPPRRARAEMVVRTAAPHDRLVAPGVLTAHRRVHEGPVMAMGFTARAKLNERRVDVVDPRARRARCVQSLLSCIEHEAVTQKPPRSRTSTT